MLHPSAFLVSKNFTDYGGIPQASVEQVLQEVDSKIDDLRLRLEVPLSPLTGHMTWTESAVLIALVKAAEVSSFFEIGTFDGSTITNLLENCPSLEDVLTVDLPDDVHAQQGTGTQHKVDQINSSMLGTVSIGSRYKSHPAAGKVTQLQKDSATLEASDLTRSTYDCIFIDGCHTYEYCKADTEFALRHLSPRGFIIWHDYAKLKALSGVTLYLLELAQSRKCNLFWLKAADLATSMVVGFRRQDFENVKTVANAT